MVARLPVMNWACKLASKYFGIAIYVTVLCFSFLVILKLVLICWQWLYVYFSYVNCMQRVQMEENEFLWNLLLRDLLKSVNTLQF